jgi:hypothetical protein
MIAARAKAFGTVGVGTFWDSGIRSAFMPTKAALFRLRNFIDAISPFNRRPAGGGPGHEPEDDGDPRDNPWNDPALWMLMMH